MSEPRPEGGGDGRRRLTERDGDGQRRLTERDGDGRRHLTEREKAVRAFFRDDRLVSIPAKPRKRDLLLPIILDRCFPEDRDYEEKEVNMRLALLHPDVAALRRYLVDGRWMTRSAGIYRRSKPMAAESADPESR